MNPRKLPIGMVMIVPIVIGFGLYAFTTQAEEVPEPEGTSAAAASVTATASASPGASLTPADYDGPTPPASEPTPTAEVRERGGFHDGARVRINAGPGECLNARNAPSMEDEWVIVNVCVPDGYDGVLTGSAQQSPDGRWWWRLAGLGWVAEEYLVYTGEFDGRTNVAPELSGRAGRVAFLRGNDVWMMNPDGSGQRLLKDNPESGDAYVPGPVDLRWSPDGTRLSYNTPRYDIAGPTIEDPGSVDLHILTVGPDGTLAEDVYERLAGGGWSPDSARLGVIREPSPDQMGSGIRGIPAVLDVTSGGQLVLGSERFWHQKPPSFNHDGTLLMVNEAAYDGDVNRIAVVIYSADGAELDRIDFSSESFGYASPAWAPDGDRIAMHVSRGERAQYEVYDVGTRQFTATAAPPAMSDKIGGRCGGGDMWNTSWSLDGQRVLYSFMFGDTGANGIWSWDVSSGAQRVIYAAEASGPSAGPDGLVMFSSNSYPTAFILYGTSDGGFPRIITDGSSPVWWVGNP